MAIGAIDTSGLAASPIIRVWRHHNYALFMSGIGPHYVTGWMQRIGVGWLAWELTHSPRWLGAVAAADLAPMILIAPFAGAVVDRSDPMRQIKFTLCLVWLHAVLLAALTTAGMMTKELLFAITLLNGSLMPFYNASRTTIVPACVPREDFPSGVSLDSSFFHGSRFVGPMIAALVIKDYGIGYVFMAHVVGVAFFILQLFRMNVTPPTRGVRTSNLVEDVVAGLAYVRSHPGIFPLFMLMTTASIAARPLQDFLPGFADRVFHSGPSGFAWLSAGMGVGAMIGATWIAMRGHTRGLTYVVILSTIVLGVSMFGFVASRHLLMAVGFAALSGFALTVMATGISALTQLAVNDGMRGRVMSLFAMIYRGVPAIGALAIGFAAEAVGLRTAFAMAALGCVLIWLTMAGAHRRIDGAMGEGK
jgi:predicted MFS family arabinose efflux permease